jgi:WhiB family redox-sensing transcriptional regulator
MRDPMAWRHQAACRGIDPEVFFPDDAEPGDAAKAVCVRCPVRQPCLEWALSTREKEGVWGGCDERDRRRILRQSRKSA